VKAPLSPADIVIDRFSAGARKATGTAVIIDVCRAFTVAAIALSRGAKEIVMVDDLQRALDLRQRGVGAYCMGERRGVKPTGFDFGNSPAEIAGVCFNGETLIQTTSNGTKGIFAATACREIYAGAFVSATATVRAIRASGVRPVNLVAMGEKDSVRLIEDEACAEYLSAALRGETPDVAVLLQSIRSAVAPRLDDNPEAPDKLSKADLDACLAIDSVPFAVKVTPVGGLIVARAVA